jgi:GT2 family glycosyltransferase
MTSYPKVSAIFATMNRSRTAVACVRALAAQTHPPELVVVADNVSTDDTIAALESLTALPFQLVIHRMPENQGNAGGVKEAMELSFARGMDAVWILDDDSWPRESAMAAMLEGPWDPHIVRHPVQIDPKTRRFTWPLQITDGEAGWKLVDSLEQFPPGDRVRSKHSWTGALLPRQVREVVGPVNSDLFIRGEDEEYPWRIEQAGFAFIAIPLAVLDHPGPENVVHCKLFGKNFFFERGLAEWKLYYKVRNMVWLKRRQSNDTRAVSMAICYGLAACILDGSKRLPILRRAILDGWNGRLGKM